MRTTEILRQLINSKKTTIAPGVFDGMSALLAKRSGFPVLYASGGAISRSAGYPDLGLLTMTEVCSVLSHIIAVTGLPVIADADTGFGNVLNVRRTVQTFEDLGVAGLHLEDQTFPKRCGHLNDKSLISIDEMCEKIRVSRSCLRDPDFVIIARTDAIAVEGFDAAIFRANAYKEAGADVIFVEAPETLEQIELIAKNVVGPKLINMFQGGKTPLVEIDKLHNLGYSLVIIPSDLQRAALRAMEITLQTIMQHGNSSSIKNTLATFNERELVVETSKYLN